MKSLMRQRAARRAGHDVATETTATTQEHLPEHGTAVRAQGLRKTYGTGAAQVVALDSVDVSFARGQFTAIMGTSGSGKSTLMHCLSGLDEPDTGLIWIGGTEITALPDDALSRLRAARIGFVFQSYNLLPVLDARGNILLPFELAGREPDLDRLAELCAELGITDRLTHRPHELSGGQQQRVAIARALLPRPDVVFADEPTGNLDSRTSAEVLDLLRTSAHDAAQTVIMVTHDPGAASYADRVLVLSDGRVSADLTAPSAEAIAAALQTRQV